MSKIQKKSTQFLLLGAMGASLLLNTGCGRTTPNVTELNGSGGASAGTGSGITSPNAPTNNFAGDNYSSQLPQPTPPQDPIDTPSPLPAPSNPVKPGEPIVMKAISNTTAFAVPQISKWFQVNGVYVHVDLSWQPVTGAAEYWIFKGKIPQFQESRRELAYAVVNSSGFKDGLQPPNLKSGDIWERAKRVFNAMTNRPGVTYEYKVVAADANGVPMSESPVVKTVALPPISAPSLASIEDNNTLTPLFKWTVGNQGVKPEGYYVSVFPSVAISGGSLPPTSFAFWTTYRPDGKTEARYGNDSSNKSSYSGTLPFDITFNLGAGKQYSWSVVGIKTDTGDMRTAHAVSRSWSGFGDFSITPDAGGVNVMANSLYRSAANAVNRYLPQVGANPNGLPQQNQAMPQQQPANYYPAQQQQRRAY